MSGGAREQVDNLYISVRSPQSKAPKPATRMEQKFFISPRDVSRAYALLLRTCRFDPEHPVGQVNSVYFDTPDLDQHERSISGELVKDKVRIRWYGKDLDPHLPLPDLEESPPAVDGKVTVWLELKSRRGFDATKQRLPIPVPAERLLRPALSQGIVPRSYLLRAIARFGFFAPGPLMPIIVISYFRYRFVEPVTGHRLSIDSHIRSCLLLPGQDLKERGLELPGAIVEVKGPDPQLPLALLELADIGSSGWTRFSKYSACIDSHDADRGSVSRLWPSGLMEDEPGILSRVKSAGRHAPASEPVPAVQRSYKTR